MEILSEKTVKIRKKHMCFACCRLFDPGVEMIRQVNTYDSINSVYTCQTCAKLIYKVSSIMSVSRP